ncbi:MAG TPA: hypothetical protein VER03_13330 [Bryobacteraceae bacterium]|nr:hypothetical protein [Bryobacteraceae bacterium]
MSFAASLLNTPRQETSFPASQDYASCAGHNSGGNKGKRGGTRVVYFHALSLTDADRKQLKEAVAELKEAVANTRRADEQIGKRIGERAPAGRGPLSE